MESQIVVFELGSEYFGVHISAVESIIKLQPITRMPHAPGFVEGVTNLRGRILPVIDLCKRFGLPSQPATAASRIIVIRAGDTEVGMIVNGVSEVLSISDEMVEATPQVAASIDAGFITGIAKIGQRLVIMLDLVKVLSKQERSDLADLSSPVD